MQCMKCIAEGNDELKKLKSQGEIRRFIDKGHV